jgi:hypothetical protein
MTKQTRVDENDERAEAAGEVSIGVDLAGSGTDQAVETTFAGGEIVDMKRTPRNPEKCIVVRPDLEKERAYCTVDEGSHQIGEPFRVNGRFTDEDRTGNPSSEALLTIFATRIAGVIATEAQQRDIDVVRVPNSETGKATAVSLRAAGFVVIEFGE